MISDMRGVMAPIPEWFLEQRRKRGDDRHDEVWDGVLHMAPQPTSWHQLVKADLLHVLRPFADARGLRVATELAVFDPVKGETNYRAPDMSVVDPRYLTRRGVEARAELVIEVLSPEDESRDKFPFFAACGIPEVWLIDPETRVAEVYVLRGSTYFAVVDSDGTVRAPLFQLELRTIEGPKLRISWRDGHAEI
jgi:Uma2 family endonuclease